MQFVVASFAMGKLVVAVPELHMLWPLAVVYIAFAASFGFVIFRHPLRTVPEVQDLD